MGLKLIAKDEVFYPADYGLGAGDVLDLVLVAGGNGAGTSPSAYAGGTTSFGSYLVASPNKGARGIQATTTSGAGGAGGYIPGLPSYGGDAILASGVAGDPPIFIPGSNAGGCYGANSTRILGKNGGNAGGGNANGTGLYGFGGAGFGAGGGSYNTTSFGSGNAGEVKYCSHILTQDDIDNGIPITIGTGYATGFTYIGYLDPTGVYTGQKMLLDSYAGSTYGGTYGIWKTFELADGTYGFTPATSSSAYPNSTTYVKFMNDDTIYTFANAFPGIPNSTGHQMYYCNGYYIGVSCSSSTNVNVYWVEAANRANYGLKQYVGVLSSWGCVGANSTSLVYSSAQTNLFVFENWTPDSDTPTYSHTLSGALPMAMSSDKYYQPYGTNGFIQMQLATSDQQQGPYYYISNCVTGTVSTIAYNLNFQWAWGENCGGYLGAALASTGSFSRHLGSTGTDNYLRFFFGTTTSRIIQGRSTVAFGFNFRPSTDNKIAVHGGFNADASLTFESKYISNGYNGVPGTDGNIGGGAGGCCMVAW